jgi:hypothetical protein
MNFRSGQHVDGVLSISDAPQVLMSIQPPMLDPARRDPPRPWASPGPDDNSHSRCLPKGMSLSRHTSILKHYDIYGKLVIQHSSYSFW